MAFVSNVGEVPRAAWVALEYVEILVEPHDASYSTGRLDFGKKITIRRDGPEGWLTIDPPERSFSLIAEADIEMIGDDRAEVVAKYAMVRAGHDAARQPGPPTVTLKQGTRVQVLDRRPLVVRRDRKATHWIPISPPRAEVRFIRPDSVSDVEPSIGAELGARRDRLASTREDLAPPSSRPGDNSAEAIPQIVIREQFLATTGIDGTTDLLSQDLRDPAKQIATRHQQMLRRALSQWDLADIEKAYRDLLPRASDGDRRILEDRIGAIRQQSAVAESAREMEEILSQSRKRDQQVDLSRRALKANRADRAMQYDASGMLQTTSKLVDGRRVHALLNDDGAVSCYLSIPAGLSMQGMVSRRVGVRGQGRYDETLRTRLIQVRDLELLGGSASPSDK